MDDYVTETQTFQLLLMSGTLRHLSSRTKYSRMDQVKFFKGCLPQILLGPFLNTLSHL